MKYCPFFSVSITSIGFIGHLQIDSSTSELRHLAPRTLFKDSVLARIITGFMIVFPFGCSSSNWRNDFVLF